LSETRRLSPVSDPPYPAGRRTASKPDNPRPPPPHNHSHFALALGHHHVTHVVHIRHGSSALVPDRPVDFPPVTRSSDNPGRPSRNLGRRTVQHGQLPVAHFACHGTQNAQSAIHLHDMPRTVTKLDRSPPNSGLPPHHRNPVVHNRQTRPRNSRSGLPGTPHPRPGNSPVTSNSPLRETNPDLWAPYIHTGP
jgi:hypothetical protein